MSLGKVSEVILWQVSSMVEHRREKPTKGSSILPLANMDNKDLLDGARLVGCGFGCGLALVVLFTLWIAATTLVIKAIWTGF